MTLSTGLNVNIEKAKLELDDYGYVVFPNLIVRGTALTMAEKLIEIEKKRASPDNPHPNLSSLFNHLQPEDQEYFIPLITHPVILNLAQHKLGDGIQLIGSDIKWTRPGTPASGIHSDVPLGWFAEQGLPTPENICFLVQVNWMLTDFTRENGATLLLPMSHKLGIPNMWPDPKGKFHHVNNRVRDLRNDLEDEDPMGHLVAAEGSAGSAVVFLGAMWHRAGANVTADQNRVGVLTPYHAKWIEPGYGLGLKDSLLLRSVRDRMPDTVKKMSLHFAEEYPEDGDYPR